MSSKQLLPTEIYIDHPQRPHPFHTKHQKRKGPKVISNYNMKKQVINTVANPFTQTIQCQSTKIMFYLINFIPKAADHTNRGEKRGEGGGGEPFDELYYFNTYLRKMCTIKASKGLIKRQISNLTTTVYLPISLLAPLFFGILE